MNYVLLTIYADLLDDLEKSRIATENRIRSLRQIKGLTSSPEEKRLGVIAVGLADAERKATNELKRAVKAHPLGAWVDEQTAVGLKSAGRLLGTIGDPYIRTDTGKPRTVNQLWRYCGYAVDDGARPKRRKGMTQEEACQLGNPAAKKEVFLIARACVYNRESPYRAVYDSAKAHVEDRVHDRPCRNTIRPVAGKPQGSNGCGTQAHPEWGEPGSPWRDGHKHQHALSVAGKTFLKDLWIEARRVHSLGETQGLPDPPQELGEAA